VVTLALPPIHRRARRVVVEGAAAVLGSYTRVVLALALPGRRRACACPGRRVRWERGVRRCSLAGLGGLRDWPLDRRPCLVLRGVQAAGAAALLVATFALLDAGGAGLARLDERGGVSSASPPGPASGGALTQGRRFD
jgi:hypothetical protein